MEDKIKKVFGAVFAHACCWLVKALWFGRCEQPLGQNPSGFSGWGKSSSPRLVVEKCTYVVSEQTVKKSFSNGLWFCCCDFWKSGRVHVAFPLPLTFSSLYCLGTGVKTRWRKGSPPGTSANLAEPCGGRESRLPEVSLGTVRCTLPLCWGIYPQASWSRWPVRAGGACEADPGARPTRGLLHAPVLPSCGRQHLAFSVSLGSWGVDENNNWTLAFLYFHSTSSSCRVWRQQ